MVSVSSTSLVGAVVVEVMPGLRGAFGGDAEPGRELDAPGGGCWLAIVTVFEDPGPVAGEGLLEVRLDLSGGCVLRVNGAGCQQGGQQKDAHETVTARDLRGFRAVRGFAGFLVG